MWDSIHNFEMKQRLGGRAGLLIMAALLMVSLGAVAQQKTPAASQAPSQPQAASQATAPAKQNKLFWQRGSHFQTEGKVVGVAEDGIHDPANSAVNILQPPVEAMQNFPRDAEGIIDWVQAMKNGTIDPRQSLTGEEVMYPVDFDIIFKKTGSMPFVKFPHLAHTEWLACANCHPAIFLPQKGANPVTMTQIIEGKYCGVCHGKVAFPPTMNCGRCHSVPRDTPGLR